MGMWEGGRAEQMHGGSSKHLAPELGWINSGEDVIKRSKGCFH